jgi:hypothetical protein
MDGRRFFGFSWNALLSGCISALARTHFILLRSAFQGLSSQKSALVQGLHSSLNTSMVDFKTFSAYLKQIGLAGPMWLHFEYSSGTTCEVKQKTVRGNTKRAVISCERQRKKWN